MRQSSVGHLKRSSTSFFKILQERTLCEIYAGSLLKQESFAVNNTLHDHNRTAAKVKTGALYFGVLRKAKKKCI